MLPSISNRSMLEILKNVRFVEELTYDIEHNIIPKTVAYVNVYGLDFYRAICVCDNADTPPIYSHTILQDGKVRIVLGDEALLADKIKSYGKEYADISSGLDRMRRSLSYSYDSVFTQGFALDLLKAIRIQCKVDKKDSVSVVEFVRAIFRIAGYSYEEEHIKQIVNAYNTTNKTFYLYETKKDIEHHYAYLKDLGITSSCMSKGIEGTPYSLAVVDKDKAEASGYQVMKRRNSEGTYDNITFTANVECFNDLPNVSLGLISEVPPAQITHSESYPFIGRFIVLERAGNKVWTTYYGREGIRGLIPYKPVDELIGMQFKAYPNWSKDIQHKSFIVPFIDGRNRTFSIDTENEFTDDIGRKYHIATVSDIQRPAIEDRFCNRHKDHLFVCSQSSWLAEKPSFRANCQITNECLYRDNAIYVHSLDGYVLDTLMMDGEIDHNYIEFIRTHLRALEEAPREWTYTLSLVRRIYELETQKD